VQLYNIDLPAPTAGNTMLSIRSAQPGDIHALLSLIRELAEFERLPISMTPEVLLRDGFGPHPRFRVLLAEWDGELAGYALTFPFYSTFNGPGLFLEDIFVREKFRGKRIGGALLAKVAAAAVEEKCFALRWQVLDWNQPAIDFYKKLDVQFLDDWREISLEGESLQRAAQGSK
jgi:GNAT superfamily N-acetyltransferase